MYDFLLTHATTMGVSLTTAQADMLLRYAQLISKWNKVYNLTATTGSKHILQHHILDCLSIIPLLPIVDSQDILDIGAGAGLPSIVIAMLTPHSVVSAEKVAKKCRFMHYIKSEFKLDNLTIVPKRVEHLHTQFDYITTRAFSSMSTTVELSANLLKKNGKYLLFKGKNWQQEASISGKIIAHKVMVPTLNTQRYILEITL